MVPKWTGDVVSKMHIHKITGTELAAALGWHPKYLSQVLNSENPPKKAEGKITVALRKLVDMKLHGNAKEDT